MSSVSRPEPASIAPPPAPVAAMVTGWPRFALPGAGPMTVALIGLVLGLSATAMVIERDWDPGAIALGPWMTRPRVGTPAIDPYARASLARSGAVPLAANEGLEFTATTDDTGYRLLRTCRYGIGGSVPAGRFWTLTATDAAGHTLDNAARRSAFTSTTVIRDLGGGVTIEVGSDARPGNWLPLSGEGPLTLTLRLYDTPVSVGAGHMARAALPSITRRSCTTPGTGATR